MNSVIFFTPYPQSGREATAFQPFPPIQVFPLGGIARFFLKKKKGGTLK